MAERILKRPLYLIVGLLGAAVIVLLLFWKPTVVVYGVQRAGLYAGIALPMALILGIVHIVNLAHGEFMITAAYITYFLCNSFGMSPLAALVPVVIVMFLLGMLIFRFTIKYTLKAPELNQLILTFGLAMVLTQALNLIATSQPRKISLDFVTSSATVGETTFGTYGFIYDLAAVLILAGLLFFLRKTKFGKAAVAVGQNPNGARIIGINVNKVYLLVFSLAIALTGIMGVLFLTSQSIFPLAGGPYTMKSFCLVAMAGMGSLPGIVFASIGLGIAESLIMSFQGYGGWSHIVFFALIIIVILIKSFKGKR